ncbi:LUD domain-containing protein [Sinomicrobium weinanense]|uniref:LUD domain-containing protein n=1 Tax=Sinomicrobium weinanense TaxID=2842200 RepID=A0A926JRR7_9FLAO|nr:LUD domain-containing protein [Sinomicrobium weinanense]MBC9796083.1 LUD domain-containing protein [Sinomicrobium weinanense]MBU3124752.1 lactate utilization protein [Sinomicrobium weinanense]
MKLLKKILDIINKPQDAEDSIEGRGKFMPNIDLPVDEKFTINFKKNGGKFIYCDSIEEIYDSFRSILTENDWIDKKIFCVNSRLKEKFQKLGGHFSTSLQGSCSFITTCENLVADNGSILVSSNQIGELKLHDLPDNLILFATTSQLVNTIGEGLRGIKNKNKDHIPTNITTIKHFNTQGEKNFLNYGSNTKNLYLLLLEDL